MNVINRHIDLDRRFRDLTEKELEDPSLLAMIGESPGYRGSSWAELLESERIVLLAEAGSGKTREMEAQQARLTADGQIAFFVPVEALDREDLRPYLSFQPGEAERFDSWLAGSTQLAWFFLDAVDELKLTDGKLDIALGKLSRAIGTARDRARIIVSCRPTDWRPVQDMEAFNKRCPPSERKKEESKITADEAFLAPIKDGSRGASKSEKKSPAEAPKVRCVILQALSETQIETFARARNVPDPKALLAAIKRNEAWSFARRPLDLDGLIANWIASGTLGTRLQQHQIDVESSLKDDPDRADHGVLSPAKATEGIEKLGLAMMRSKARTIRSLEEAPFSVDPASLDATAILHDWTTAEVKALLRRAIFDPATYGRVRFHHRSVQEFLAARRLLKLAAAGLPKRQLRSLLFADTYGEKVVIPTMRPVVAWLSQWDTEIARETLRREPEVLILHGDPESLSADLRQALIGAYVTAYTDGGWRGLEMPIAELQRLANPDLSQEIRRLWRLPHANEEVRDFLLRLIWLGAIQDCADIALEALLDASLGDHARIVGARALGDCQRYDLLRRAADDLLSNRIRWSDRIVHSIVDELYPNAISSAELERLIRETREPTRTVGGMSWTLYNLAEALEPRAEAAIAFRALLANLIFEGIERTADWYLRANRFAYLTPALAKLAHRQLNMGTPDADLIRACILAHHYHGDNTVGSEEVKGLRQWFHDNPSYRERTFWDEFGILLNGDVVARPGQSAYRMHEHTLSGYPQDGDRKWLLRRLRKPDATGRDVAFDILLQLWNSRGRPDADLAALRAAVGAGNEMSAQLDAIERPPSNADSEQFVAMQLENQRYKAEHAARQANVEASWSEWKAKADADPASMVYGREKSKTMWTLIHWLSQGGRGNSHLAYGGVEDIRSILGDVIADGFLSALKKYWRSNEPPVYSKRTAEQQNTIWNSQNCALTALQAEATADPSWADKLTASQTRRATGWALTELNGFPEWLAHLASVQAKPVQSVLEQELQFELDRVALLQHPRTLSALRYQSGTLQELVAPFLHAALLTWPNSPRLKAKADIQSANLDSALRIVAGAGKLDLELAIHCDEQFQANLKGAASTIWLQGVFAFDLDRGLAALKKGLLALPKAKRKAQAVIWFGALFGDRFNERSPISISNANAGVLADLVRLSYGYVRVEDDIEHHGVYSPGPRDNAQGARNQLLNALFGIPGHNAYSAIKTLADEILFTDTADRLRLIARRRAADDSEAVALSAIEYRTWDDRFEIVPHNRDELFQIMLDRLDDIVHDTRHHDFTDRSTLQDMLYETDMQPLLAKKFNDAAKGQYQVVREDEVADKKKTDIRLLSRGSADRAVVELKLGDNYSITQLESALTTQLVGQYLRHNDCTAGCLLITYAGRKDFHDASGACVPFDEVINGLVTMAVDLQLAESGRIKLAVVGLDLRPVLSTADTSTARSRRKGQLAQA